MKAFFNEAFFLLKHFCNERIFLMNALSNIFYEYVAFRIFIQSSSNWTRTA